MAPVTVALSEVARGAGLGNRVDHPRRGDGVKVGCLLGAWSGTVQETALNFTVQSTLHYTL